MIRIRKTFAFAALALALSAAGEARAQSGVQPSAHVGAAHWRGSRNEQLIDQALRHYGYRPNRLTRAQQDAIQQAWYELLGTGSGRRTLSRAQATAIVYMALVHPYEEDGWDEGRRGGGWNDRPGGGWNDRPGGGYDDDAPPYRPGEACVQMDSDAYRLENLIISAGGNGGLFVVDPEKGRARTLARQIQQRAVECRASAVADRASDILNALAAPLPQPVRPADARERPQARNPAGRPPLSNRKKASHRVSRVNRVFTLLTLLTLCEANPAGLLEEIRGRRRPHPPHRRLSPRRAAGG
jgi:hypothetical protein